MNQQITFPCRSFPWHRGRFILACRRGAHRTHGTTAASWAAPPPWNSWPCRGLPVLECSHFIHTFFCTSLGDVPASRALRWYALQSHVSTSWEKMSAHTRAHTHAFSRAHMTGLQQHAPLPPQTLYYRRIFLLSTITENAWIPVHFFFTVNDNMENTWIPAQICLIIWGQIAAIFWRATISSAPRPIGCSGTVLSYLVPP